ncbi:hypothetical protein V144x_12770 [Gimesia aquarii]|uniref:Uncharacterized protein n=1 Tax=Gimesia aquarii TaxID=2527964 RepID=A0A517VSA5_9PLAN|nr:hypothetical protein V144x_12770 [Gimesia aquarii]
MVEDGTTVNRKTPSFRALYEIFSVRQAVSREKFYTFQPDLPFRGTMLL